MPNTNKTEMLVIRKLALAQLRSELFPARYYLKHLQCTQKEFASQPLGLCIASQYKVILQYLEKLQRHAIKNKEILSTYLVSSGSVPNSLEAEKLMKDICSPDKYVCVADGIVETESYAALMARESKKRDSVDSRKTKPAKRGKK